MRVRKPFSCVASIRVLVAGMSLLACTEGDGREVEEETPLFAVTDCGSIAVGDEDYSTNLDAPATFSVGTLVEGRIDPDSASNQRHYWDTSLPAGNYHLVLDTSRVDDSSSNIGLLIEELDRIGVVQGQLIRGNEIDRKVRLHTFFTVPFETLLRLQITPNFDTEDYVLGIFPNGTGVSSPFFDECPTLVDLSLDVEQTIDLADEGMNGEEQWFTLTVDPGDYRFTLDATRVDGENSNIIFEIGSYDQFGQASRYSQILRANEINTTVRLSEIWNVTEAGTYWIRMRNTQPAITLQLTIAEE